MRALYFLPFSLLLNHFLRAQGHRKLFFADCILEERRQAVYCKFAVLHISCSIQSHLYRMPLSSTVVYFGSLTPHNNRTTVVSDQVSSEPLQQLLSYSRILHGCWRV